MAKELLLLEDVDNLGRSGDIVKARPGFVRNFLLPQKKAIVATAAARRMQQKLQEERAKKAVVDKTEAEALAAKIQDLQIKTEVKVDQDGNMYGSVGVHDLLKLLNEQGFALEKRNVYVPHPIKTLGMHTVQLRLKEGVKATIQLEIVQESA